MLTSRQGTASRTSENIVLQKALSRILGFALLLYGCAALAFTLPPAPTEEQASPSNTITDATTLETQVQPIAGTIRAQLLGLRRPQAPAKSARLSTRICTMKNNELRRVSASPLPKRRSRGSSRASTAPPTRTKPIAAQIAGGGFRRMRTASQSGINTA